MVRFFLNANNILFEKQLAFRNNRPATHKLIENTEIVKEMLVKYFVNLKIHLALVTIIYSSKNSTIVASET